VPTASSDCQQQEWDAYVVGRPDATGYHQWRWRNVFSQAFGHDCEYLVVRQNGEISGVLPIVVVDSWLFGRFGVSLPFVNYGGVLADTPHFTEALVHSAAASAKKRRLSHLEFRHRSRICPDLPSKQHKVAMLLPLAAAASDMWMTFDRKARNQIRKAEKSGLDLQIGGVELLDDFYTVFAHNMRDLGTPVYSKAFFAAVFQEFPADTRVFLVKKAQQPIAAGISYAFRHVIEVPWASSLREFLPLSPNNLLYWSVIQYAIEHGYRTLDFGRSTPNEGTFHFKRQWGAEPSPLYWEYQLISRKTIPDQSPKNPKLLAAIEAWKRLPLAVANWLGPSIVRGIP
jgi:FemAB-related protein (PEP-CTERM system-associated)